MASFLALPDFSGWLLIAKIILITFSVIILAGVIFFTFRSSWAKYLLVYDIAEFLNFRPYGIKKIERIWNKIKARLDTGTESEYKLAVIEADNMLNDALKRMGYGGETLRERLKKLTSATLPNIDQVYEAHQTRNNIVHDPNYRLPLDEVKRIMDIYENAFRDLDAF